MVRYTTTHIHSKGLTVHCNVLPLAVCFCSPIRVGLKYSVCKNVLLSHFGMDYVHKFQQLLCGKGV